MIPDDKNAFFYAFDKYSSVEQNKWIFYPRSLRKKPVYE